MTRICLFVVAPLTLCVGALCVSVGYVPNTLIQRVLDSLNFKLELEIEFGCCDPPKAAPSSEPQE